MNKIVFSLILISQLSHGYLTSRNLRYSRNSRLQGTVSAQTLSIFDRIKLEKGVGGAGGSSSLDGLIKMDENWNQLKNGGWKNPPYQIATQHLFPSDHPNMGANVKFYNTFDISVCGGTLGIFYAMAMQRMGYKT